MGHKGTRSFTSPFGKKHSLTSHERNILNLSKTLATYTRQLKSASWSMNSNSWLMS